MLGQSITPSSVIYKIVPGFPAYRVGSDGSVWTCRRKGGNDRSAERLTATWRMMKLHRHDGYFRVNLVRDGKTYSRAVHCLVLETFTGPCPKGMEACHYPDHDRGNNHVDNLRWDTHAENMRDKYRDRVPTTEKTCARCRQSKPKSEFYRDNRAADGLKTECRSCHAAIVRRTVNLETKRRNNRAFMRRHRGKA